jgi:hypothetical protein
MNFLQRPAPTIQFLCKPKDEGVIAPPVPAKPYLPDWFRKLPAVDDSKLSQTDTGLTGVVRGTLVGARHGASLAFRMTKRSHFR